MVFSRACPRCHGAGVQRVESCRTCGGIGLHTRSETVTLRVPAGRARMARGCGSPTSGTSGPHGGPPGDLYVTLQVSPDARFRREGDDLHVVLPLAVHEAALGARIEVDDARRPRARARAAGHAVGAAVPAARAAARRRCRTATAAIS